MRRINDIMYCDDHDTHLVFQTFDTSYAIYECPICHATHAIFVFKHQVDLWDKSPRELLNMAEEARQHYEAIPLEKRIASREANEHWETYGRLKHLATLVPDDPSLKQLDLFGSSV